MLKHILTTMVLMVALFTATSGAAWASISEPDVVYYGTALNAAIGGKVPGTVTMTLTGATTPVASCTVGVNRKYVLRIPMDALDPRLPNTARTGDAAAISVDGVLADGTIVIPARGSLVKLDLGARTKEQWAKDHPGDIGAGDMNKNGISDLTEYLSGKDPASCVWTAVDAGTVKTTVYYPLVLQNCLTDAGIDGKHNLIRIAQGTYPGNFTYKTDGVEAAGAYNLTLIGGYAPTPVWSEERSADPSLTILNGDTDNDGIGNGNVFTLDTVTNNSAGLVHIEGLTIKNGKAPVDLNGKALVGLNGGGIQARIFQGGLELVGNIISGNSADSGGGVSIESSDTGSVFLTNNVLYGNSAGTAAAVRIVSSSTGPVTLLNNTIADTTATVAGDGRALLITSTTAAITMTNNIIAVSSGVAGKDIYLNSLGVTLPLTITHNAYDAVNGLNATGFVPDGSTVDAAPLFVESSAGNYRLSAASPCIDKGITHAKLPTTDADGMPRISGIVDIGAYEFRGFVTNPATAQSGAGATLNGTVNANNTSTTVSFDYGTTTSYGSSVTAVPSPVAGIAGTSVSAVVTGLIPNTLYHFRVKGVNVGGVTFGNDLSFVTQQTTRQLNLTVSGSGSGSVTSDSAHPGIVCPGTCQAGFGSGAVVALTPYPSVGSTFNGWFGGGCSGTGACNVSMTGDMAVSATFNSSANQPVMVGNATYATVPLAYAPLTTTTGSTIKIQGLSYTGNVMFDLGKTVILKGGYDTGFLNQAGYTTLQGTFTIKSGTVVVDRVTIK